MRAASRAARALARARRGMASDALATESSAFTRFTSPVPSAYSHTAFLGAPETKARR